jgi:hypothetical protein
MPPQQPDRLLDVVNDALNLGAHFVVPVEACLESSAIGGM